MRITISERLKPFSHTPGIYFILPGSQLRAQIFPTLIRIHDLSKKVPQLLTELSLTVLGPIIDFTVLQDLEKGRLQIWGQTSLGYMRYSLRAIQGNPESFLIEIEKQPNSNLTFISNSDFQIKEIASLPNQTLMVSKGITKADTISHSMDLIERLSLGNHKSQDWGLMQRRCDFKEIFPLWMRLGQLLQKTVEPYPQDDKSLINECQKAINCVDRNGILQSFNNLYLAGFDLGLSPRLKDEQYQGFVFPPLADSMTSPLQILTEGAHLIRRLFIQTNSTQIKILPALPTEFHCGRLTQANCGKNGICDIEWSKKVIRRMIFLTSQDTKIDFVFTKDVNRFRLRTNEVDKGQIILSGSSIEFAAGQSYLFDHFE